MNATTMSMHPSVFLAEIVDKEPTLFIVWLVAIVLSVGSLALCRWRRWTAFIALAAVAVWAVARLSELGDPFVGPAILQEFGHAYIIQSYIAAFIPLIFIVVGVLPWQRKTMTGENVDPSSKASQDPAVAIAAARLAIESEKLRYPAQAAIQLEVFKGANERGALAIKSSMIINGGGAVALLTLISHLASLPDVHLQIQLITKALSFFVGGVWCAMIATGLAYVTAICVVAKREEDLSTLERWKKRIARTTNGLAIVFVAASMVCFTCGCWKSYVAILRLPPANSNLHQVI